MLYMVTWIPSTPNVSIYTSTMKLYMKAVPAAEGGPFGWPPYEANTYSKDVLRAGKFTRKQDLNH